MPEIITAHTDTFTLQLEQFRAELGAHYEEAHFILACHAAFPAFITPDLLYQIWANFKSWPDRQGRTQIMPALTVSDVLLSSLFRITGPELYEMKPEVSAALVRHLAADPRFGPDRIKALASFLYQYALAQPNKPGLQQFREAQQWTALMAMNPALATEKLLKALMEKAGSQQVNQSLGIMNLMEGFAKGSEGFTEELSARLQPTIEEVPRIAAIESIPGNGTTVEEGIILDESVPAYGILGKVELPGYVSTRLEGMRKTEETKSTTPDTDTASAEQLPIIRILLIAISEYNHLPLSEPVTHAHKLLKKLRSLYPDRCNVQLCLNQDATVRNATTLLQEMLQATQTNETLLIYFSGHGINSIGGDQGLIMHDYDFMSDAPASNGILRMEHFRQIVNEFDRSDARITLMLDCDSGHTGWLPISSRKNILSASYLGERIAGPLHGGAFTEALLAALPDRESQGYTITYQDIYERILEHMDRHFISQKTALQTPMFSLAPKIFDNIFLGYGTTIKLPSIRQLLLNNGYWLTAQKQFIEDHLLSEDADLRHYLLMKLSIRQDGGMRIVAFLEKSNDMDTIIHRLFEQCGQLVIASVDDLQNEEGMIPPETGALLANSHVVMVSTRSKDAVIPETSLLYAKIARRTYAKHQLFIAVSQTDLYERKVTSEEKVVKWDQLWNHGTRNYRQEHNDNAFSCDYEARSQEELDYVQRLLLRLGYMRAPLTLNKIPLDDAETTEPEKIGDPPKNSSIWSTLTNSIRKIWQGNPKEGLPPTKQTGDVDDDPDDDDDDDDENDIDMNVPTPELPLLK